MNLTVIDSGPAMLNILDAPAAERPELLRELWQPMAGMYRYFPGQTDLVQAHLQSFGFPIDRDSDDDSARNRTAVRLLTDADAWQRIRAGLERGIDALHAADPEAAIPDLTVLLVVGDPGNDHFTREVQGLSAFGGISGYIAITVWPNETVLGRLEAIAAHELHHNVRYSPGGVVWNPATVTVGEQVISEGLADEFAAELYGDTGYTHFVAPETRVDDAVLQTVARGLDVTGMQNFTAWVHGDASARLFGAEPVGLPTGAGYAAGARLVRAYLDQQGYLDQQSNLDQQGAVSGTAAAQVRTPAQDIIDVARQRLRLPAG
ncbi:DUF2268 domain-containing protein [Nakamurella aerolata]|nr:DUF2268 domain-containing putative Zn-dependent protease [Nakamurella aerolata]